MNRTNHGIEPGQGTQPGDIAISRDRAFKPFGDSGIYGDIEVSNAEENGKSGRVCIRGVRFELKGGCIDSTGNKGKEAGGGIDIRVSGEMIIENEAGIPNGGMILSSTFGEGDAGPISITAEKLSVKNGGSITSMTAGAGKSGDIEIVAAESIDVARGNGMDMIAVKSFSDGDTGDLRIQTSALHLSEKGSIISLTAGSGDAGKIEIQAKEITQEDGGLAVTSLSNRIISN